MEEIKLSPKKQEAFDEICKWFTDPKSGALTAISIPTERHMTRVKILSRLACLQEKLTDHIEE